MAANGELLKERDDGHVLGLTEQLLAGVYERLLCSDDRNGMTPVVGQAIDVEASAVLPAQFVTTGGPW